MTISGAMSRPCSSAACEGLAEKGTTRAASRHELSGYRLGEVSLGQGQLRIWPPSVWVPGPLPMADQPGQVCIGSGEGTHRWRRRLGAGGGPPLFDVGAAPSHANFSLVGRPVAIRHDTRSSLRESRRLEARVASHDQVSARMTASANSWAGTAGWGLDPSQVAKAYQSW